jgi:2-dehydro-3-deoxyphosphogluconate aldolase/(4S)-4-hydroxy-2-oxoglutarate aldolase
MTAKPNQQRLEPEVIARIRAAKILAVVVVDEPECAVPLVEALQAGGISGIELTLRTPAAFEALRLVRQAYPELLIGMGTLIDKAQVAPAVAGGADFAVAPGCNPALLSGRGHAQRYRGGFGRGADALEIFPRGAMRRHFLFEIDGCALCASGS